MEPSWRLEAARKCEEKVAVLEDDIRAWEADKYPHLHADRIKTHRLRQRDLRQEAQVHLLFSIAMGLDT